MSFINFPSPTPVFPVLPTLGWSVHKKPIMASRTTIAMTGRETKLACCVYPRWSFILTYGGGSWLRDQTQNIVTDPTLPGLTELKQLSSLFLACLGKYGEFYYSDPEDNSRENEGVGVASGTNALFPLFYSWGSGPFSPPFFAPVTGIQSIDAVYFNGIAQSPSIYSMDSTNTALLFNSNPPQGTVITADFHFYFRCSFLDDTQNYNQFEQNLWEVKEVRFESVKP